MFEAILSICLLAEPSSCRDILLPGFEATSATQCEAALKASDSRWKEQFSQYNQVAPPSCAQAVGVAKFEKVGDGIFAHRGDISDAAPDNFGDVSNVGFVIGDTSIAVIDTGGSRKIAEQVYRAIREKSDLPISHVILTHMHPDHVLGASVFANIGAIIVGHANLGGALGDREETYLDNFGERIGAAEFIGTQIVPPDVIVDGFLNIELGNRLLEIRSWPQAHTSTDLTVLDNQSGILFTGDLVFGEHAPVLDGLLSGWQLVLEKMENIGATMIIPGHGGPILQWPSASRAMLNYLNVLETDTRAAIKKGIRLGKAVDIIAQSESGNWQLFELFNPRNATVAYTQLEWE
ncbi:MAG: quinoprotein relay system zinc metallohydrolase 2 [Hyphomicrobiales bacterium]|nr:quinoprotein relay system zinc metallohydrolase 2 [Hyphomicrobiales bacterium]